MLDLWCKRHLLHNISVISWR